MADTDKNDWDSIRFRPRRTGVQTSPDDDAHSRFVVGAILFVVVALAYPWYSYWVHSRLAAAEMRQALATVEQEMRTASTQVDDAIEESRTAPVLPAHRSRPRILGVSEGAALSVIIADLDGASLAEAEPRLCMDAARWMRRPTAGRTFRVQSFRRSEPALTAGTIQC